MRDAETGFISKKHTVQLYNPDGKLGQTICVFVSVCLHGSVFLPLCHSLFLCVTHFALCHSLLLSVTHSCSLSLTFPLCHSFFPSVTYSSLLSLTLPLCHLLFLSVTHSCSLSLTLALYLSLLPCVSMCLCVRCTRECRCIYKCLHRRTCVGLTTHTHPS